MSLKVHCLGIVVFVEPFSQISLIVFQSLVFALSDAPPTLQSSLSENELGGSEEVHQRSHQQSQRVQHCQHHSGAAAGEHRQGQVNANVVFVTINMDR